MARDGGQGEAIPSINNQQSTINNPKRSEVGGQKSEVSRQERFHQSTINNQQSTINNPNMGNYSPETDDSVLSETMDEVQEPSMYRVLIHNDDYTSMEFVVDILQFVFNKSMEQATLIMLKVHNEGIGLCGVYTYEVAETKVGTVETLASGNGFPLKCTMERD